VRERSLLGSRRRMRDDILSIAPSNALIRKKRGSNPGLQVSFEGDSWGV
jgi:hypothetical protein